MSAKLVVDYASLAAEARRYKNKTDFLNHNPSWFRAAKRCGVLAEVFGDTHSRWTNSSVAIEASKFRNAAEFSRLSSGAYQYAKRNGLVPSLFPSLRIKWTEELLKAEVALYSSRVELKRSNESAYNAIKRMGLDHLLPQPLDIRWTEQTAREEAKKYRTKFEFQLGNASAYVFARANGFLNDLGFVQGASTFDFNKPSFLYMASVITLTGYNAIVIGISNRHPSKRYLASDKQLMSNRIAFTYATGQKAFSVEKFIKHDYIDFAIPEGSSPLTEKKGNTGEILLDTVGVHNLLHDIAYFGYGDVIGW